MPDGSSAALGAMLPTFIFGPAAVGMGITAVCLVVLAAFAYLSRDA